MAMNRLFRKTVLAVGLTICSVFAMATPTLNTAEYWTTDDGGWDVAANSPFPSDPGFTVTHDNLNGYLLFTLPAVSNPPPSQGWGSTDGTGYSPNFLGNYTYVTSLGGWMTIKFVTFGNTPDQLDFYFQGGTVSTNTYTFDLLAQEGAPSQWGTKIYTVTWGSTAGWNLYGGTLDPDQFALDMASISAIGLNIQGSAGLGQEIYGLDYMGFVVPEPESIWLVLAVALSLAITFRARLADAFAQVRERVRKT